MIKIVKMMVMTELIKSSLVAKKVRNSYMLFDCMKAIRFINTPMAKSK
jgi:hypothetical protein